MASQYQYQALDGGSTQIRILHLAQEPGEELFCRIEHVDVENAEFTALSYAWGSLEKPYQIQVRDAEARDLGAIPLTENLNNAIHDLHNSPEVTETTFWIDQICIQQDDKSEQSHQVALMANIFSNAKQVITYMGPSAPDDEAALKLLMRIDSHFAPFYNTPEITKAGTDKYFYNKPPDHLDFKITKDDPNLYALYQLLSGQWTTRLWTVQENVLNRHTIMLRGHKLISASIVAAAYKLAYCGLIPSKLDMFGIISSQTMIRDLRAYMHFFEQNKVPLYHQRYSLVQLIRSMSYMKCSEPRDRIYALLAIAEDSQSLNIIPDYTASLKEVLVGLTVALLRTENLDTVLENWTALPDRHGDLPSWVPSFDRSDTRQSAIVSGWVAEDMSSEFTLENNEVLVLHGIHLTTISDHLGTFRTGFTSLFHSENPPDDDEGAFTDDLSIINKARQRLGDSPNTDTIIYHTIMGVPLKYEVCDIDIDIAGQGLRQVISMILSKLPSHTQLIGSEERSLNGAIDETNENDSSEVVRSALDLIQYGAMLGRELWTTDDGRLCMSALHARRGDVVAIILGGSTLYILRPIGNGEYIYIGDAHIYDEMRGESLKGEEWRSRLQKFRIV